MMQYAFLAVGLGVSTASPSAVVTNAMDKSAGTIKISNHPEILDMAQNDPGDYSWTPSDASVTGVGWQQSKYFDPAVLAALNYTGRVTTGEISPFLTVTFDSISGGQPFFNSTELAWVMQARAHATRTAIRVKNEGMLWVPFVDMIVFPKPVIARFGTQILDSDGHIVWNDVTRKLVSAMLNETAAIYAGLIDGILVRTGETYVYDTPYHAGNSPVETCNKNTTCQQAIWVNFISELRGAVCEKAGLRVFFRAWDSFGGWSGDPAYYLNVTDPVLPHDLLYFSVKHTAGDFFQFMGWNGQLAVGRHAQVVEVELQREYEGKGAYPNYIMQALVNGSAQLPDGSDQKGLVDVLAAPQIKGLWTWSRGGGWFGPYVHGREEWIDPHVYVLQCWWAANYGPAQGLGPDKWSRHSQVRSERQCWDDFVQSQWVPRLEAEARPRALGLGAGSVLSAGEAQVASDLLRYVALNGTLSVTNGHYCPEGSYSDCWSWTRDNRLGGVADRGVQAHLGWLLEDATGGRMAASAHFKREAILNAGRSMAALEALQQMLDTAGKQRAANRSEVEAGLSPRVGALGSPYQPPLLPFLRATVEYAQHLWTIVDAGWCVMREGWKMDHPTKGLPANKTLLLQCGQTYRDEWAAYRALGLFCEHSPSLYRGVYFNLPGGAPQPGLDATVDDYTSRAAVRDMEHM